MTPAKRLALLILGSLSALLIVSQFVMGMLILRTHSEKIIRGHLDSGYLTVAVVLVYIVASLMVIASLPKKNP